LSDPDALAAQVRVRGSAKVKAADGLRSRAIGVHGGSEYSTPLIEKLKGVFADTLGLEPDGVDPDAQLETYVRDSLDNVMLTVELKKLYPNIPITILFEHRSLASIATYLLQEHASAVRRPPAADAVALDLSVWPSTAATDRESTSRSDTTLVYHKL